MSTIEYKKVSVKNKKAAFEFHLSDRLEAGIMLSGTEIKSIRQGKASIAEAYCYFRGEELYVKNMDVAEYSHGTHYNHEAKRDRKLLLHRKELHKFQKKVSESGFTIVPLHLYISDTGKAKLEIALAKGKKLFDKREDLKSKDVGRDLARIKKGDVRD
jgi:SsrA-binding protein